MSAAVRGMARGDGAYLIMAALDECRVSWEIVEEGFRSLGTQDPTLEEAHFLLVLLGKPGGSVERIPNFKRSEAERRWRRGVLGGGATEHANNLYKYSAYDNEKTAAPPLAGVKPDQKAPCKPRNERAGRLGGLLFLATDQQLDWVEAILSGSLPSSLS